MRKLIPRDAKQHAQIETEGALLADQAQATTSTMGPSRMARQGSQIRPLCGAGGSLSGRQVLRVIQVTAVEQLALSCSGTEAGRVGHLPLLSNLITSCVAVAMPLKF